MIVQCTECHTKYKVDDSKFAGKPAKKIKCPKCAHIFEVKNPAASTQAPRRAAVEEPPEAPPDETTDMKESRERMVADMMGGGVLELPPDKKLSLAVIRGANQGKIFPIDKPRMTIGRSSADIVVNDLEVSRQHAAIEVFSDKYVLRDLNSTNGTFVEGVKIKFQPLDNHSEFRVGNTTLMLIVTGTEEDEML
ncbi:MAG: FHA domain-containing protein [Acidobacteriota bacterium]